MRLTQEISNNGQETDAKASKGSGGGNVSVEFLLHRGIAMSTHGHLLFLQLLGNIAGRGTRDFNPGLGEEGARGEHESQIEERMEWVRNDIHDTGGR